jgi:hypothetical protein
MNFTDTRGVLNRKPKIQFVEPNQIPGQQKVPAAIPPSIEVKQAQITELIDQYSRLETLSNIAQQRIDKRARDLKACLDPQTDVGVLASLRRKFGDVGPCITYEQYKICLQELSDISKKAAIKVTPADLEAATNDQFRTTFGGLNEDGTISQVQGPVKPVDPGCFPEAVCKETI